MDRRALPDRQRGDHRGRLHRLRRGDGHALRAGQPAHRPGRAGRCGIHRRAGRHHAGVRLSHRPATRSVAAVPSHSAGRCLLVVLARRPRGKLGLQPGRSEWDTARAGQRRGLVFHAARLGGAAERGTATSAGGAERTRQSPADGPPDPATGRDADHGPDRRSDRGPDQRGRPVYHASSGSVRRAPDRIGREAASDNRRGHLEQRGGPKPLAGERGQPDLGTRTDRHRAARAIGGRPGPRTAGDPGGRRHSGRDRRCRAPGTRQEGSEGSIRWLSHAPRSGPCRAACTRVRGGCGP